MVGRYVVTIKDQKGSSHADGVGDNSQGAHGDDPCLNQPGDQDAGETASRKPSGV